MMKVWKKGLFPTWSRWGKKSKDLFKRSHKENKTPTDEHFHNKKLINELKFRKECRKDNRFYFYLSFYIIPNGGKVENQVTGVFFCSAIGGGGVMYVAI